MSRYSLFWPLIIIIATMLAISMVFTAPAHMPNAIPANLETCPSQPPYPSACQTQITQAKQNPYPNVCAPGADHYPVCQTQTAQAGIQPTNSPTQRVTSTATITSTVTTAPTPQTPTNTSTATKSKVSPTPTLTETPDPNKEMLTCIPDMPLSIEGSTEPYTALLLYFNQRPVGGATSDATGFYSLKLVIGEERAGTYTIEVQVRGQRKIIRETACVVPESTPTPTMHRF